MSFTPTRREVLRDAAMAASVLGAAALASVSGAQEAANTPAEPVPAPETPVQQTDLDRIRAYLSGNESVKWVFAGDSITHGARHLMGHQDYMQLTEERVRWELGLERNLFIKTATSGWSIARISEDLDWRMLQFAPQIASFHFGMNDCKGGEEGIPAFKQQYLDVIRRTREACNSAIIVHTPNPIIPAGDGNREPYLPGYVDAVRQVADEAGAVLVDHYANWLTYMESAQIFYLMDDALHPNWYGHIFMAHALFRVLGVWDSDNSAMCRLFVPR